MRHKIVPNYMPARGQDIELSRNTFSKKDWRMDIVLLHLELSLNFSRHIRHGRVLTNIGLWSRIHEIQIGVFTESRMSLEALDISETDK